MPTQMIVGGLPLRHVHCGEQLCTLLQPRHHLSPEPVDTVDINDVLQPSALTIFSIAVVPEGGDDCFGHIPQIALTNPTQRLR